MRFIVLGGAGDMGNEAVRTLASHQGVEEVMVADLDFQSAHLLAAELGDPVRARRLDVLDPPALVDSIRGYDAALGFVGPFLDFEGRLIRAALEAGTHYVSIADDFEAARDALALGEAAKAAGVTAVTGLGNCPGLTNLLAKKGAALLESPRRVNIAWFGGADDAGGYANYRHAVHVFCGKVPTFRGGREVLVPAGSGGQIVEFPAPCGRLPVYHTGHAEPVTLPQNMPQLQEVTLRGGIWPSWLSRMGILLVRAGLVRGERSQRFWANFFYRVLPRLPKGKCTQSGFRVDVWGEKDGKEAHVWYAAIDRMKRITSIPAALGAVMLARGEIGERGVFAPEAVINPDVMLSRLEPYGIRIESSGP
ncbi:MAG: saccharopine dehydrogenase NADP-binding domain-containing protein [Dehalococcoidia bacterium]|nr:saccharopine dehydrogenase NADP-binding domain-containing protein [Dehalococcoidia bacterium]